MQQLLWEEPAPGALGEEPQDRPWLDLFPLKSQKPAPAIVVCPGGGYWVHAEHEAQVIARWINSLGIAAFVLHYRLAPYKHPAALLDAQRAIRIVRTQASQWNVDPRRVGILGFSAGGHVSAMAGTHFDRGNTVASDPIERASSRPDLMVLCYPLITFGGGDTHGAMVNLIGENPPDELRRSLCADQQVTADTPPAFMWHTADDAVVPVENCTRMADALSKHKVPFALHVFACGQHGLGLATEDPDVGQWTKVCASWLKGQGF